MRKKSERRNEHALFRDNFIEEQISKVSSVGARDDDDAAAKERDIIESDEKEKGAPSEHVGVQYDRAELGKLFGKIRMLAHLIIYF